MKSSALRLRRATVLVAIIALLLAAPMRPARAQAPRQTAPDVPAIVKETEQVYQAERVMTLVWWMPEQYLQAAMVQNSDISPDKIEAIVKALRGYTIVAVIEGKLGVLGKLEYTPEDTLATEVLIKDSAGNSYTPLPDEQVNGDAKTFLGVMKPLMTNMMGAFGQNFNFFVFPGQGKDGKVIADATKEGLFYVEVGAREFRWRLPLGSLLPRKICPLCKESLSGAYKYCPYDGTKLPEPASAPSPPAKL